MSFEMLRTAEKILRRHEGGAKREWRAEMATLSRY